MTQFEKWKSEFENLSFEEYAKKIRDKILESPQLEPEAKEIFKDAFEYMLELTEAKKPLDTNLLKIRLVDIKGHKNFDMIGFTQVLMLLSLCGFQFDFLQSQ